MPSSVVQLVRNDFNFSMSCISSILNAQVKWNKRNDVLPPHAHGVSSSNLTIYKMIPNDTGEYQCVVSNSTGTIASEYTMLTAGGMYVHNMHIHRVASNFLIPYCKGTVRRY